MKKAMVVIAVTLSFFAGMAAAPASRRYINLPRANNDSKLPFSDAVLVGDTLYLSGRIGFDPATGKPPADIDQEIKNLFDGVTNVLKESGMTMDDLVSVQVFCPDLSLYDRFNAAYRSRFNKELPARAFIGSGPLLRGGHFEMMAIAVKQ
jgi:enamine deaminase RidA (YjgF/YER057c/UK114 family)